MTQPTNPYDGVHTGSDSTTPGMTTNPYGATSTPSLTSGAPYSSEHSNPSYQQPYNQQGYGQQGYGQGHYNGAMYQQYANSVPPRQTSSLAIGSLISGIASWTVFPVFGAIVAIILGHLALSEIRKFNKDGRGLAIGGLAMGYIQFALGIIFILVLLLGVFGSIGLATSTSTY